MKTLLRISVVLFAAVVIVSVASADTHTSAGTGNWNTAATWSPSSVPIAGDAVIIANTHNVTVNAATAAVTSITINSGGTLTVTTFNVSATTITVNGTIVRSGAGTLPGTGVTFNTGSKYIHNQTGGSLPTATWNANSTIEFSTAGSISVSAGGSNLNIGRMTVINNTTVTLTGTSSMTLTINAGTGDDLVIEAGSSLTLGTNINITLATSATANIAGTLTINTSRTFDTNGTSVVTTVTGRIVNNGTVTCTNLSKLLLQSGATYEHARATGTIPTATWNSNSTLLITGITGASSAQHPTYGAQAFGNVTVNSNFTGSGNNLCDAAGGMSIAGTLTITNAGTGQPLSLAQSPLSVGNMVLGSGGYFSMGGGGTARTLNITGNLSLTNDAILDLSFGGSATATGTVNLDGNYSQSGTSILRVSSTSSGDGAFHFSGNSTQTFSKSGGTISCNNSASNTLAFSIDNLATVDFGTSILNDDGSSGTSVTFTLTAPSLGNYGGIITANTAGITTSGATGSVQVGGTRSYYSGDYTYNGSSAQATGDGINSAIHNLTINNSAGVTLSQAINISNIFTLTLGNLITTGTNMPTVASTGSISGGSATGYVDGPMCLVWSANTSKTFPIGKGTAYRPVTLNVTNGSTPDWKAEVFNSGPGGTPGTGLDRISGVRYWQLSNYGGSITASTVNLTYGVDDGVTSASNLRLVQCTTSVAGTYNSRGGTGTGAPSGNITSTIAGTSTGYFTLGDVTSGGNPLPVELVSFSGAMLDNGVELRWLTASEVNNYGFDIERKAKADEGVGRRLDS